MPKIIKRTDEIMYALLTICIFVAAMIYTRKKYEQGEGFIAIPRISLFMIFADVLHRQFGVDNGSAFGIFEPIIIAATFGFFISLDRVNKRNISVLKELRDWDIEDIAKLLDLDNTKKDKLFGICRSPEEKL
ncbi:MAG: hypothetical protein IPG70_10705 [Moraxellaceae bacterium]|jgi:hypothetical protein|nr:hypothetical protein [Moraxellaceae bacterium]